MGELTERMDVPELMHWMAHDRLNDPERRKAPTLNNLRAAFAPVRTNGD